MCGIVGIVSNEILKIKMLDNILCELKISTLADKFNNGISNNFNYGSNL